jgi:hypothetical protein
LDNNVDIELSSEEPSYYPEQWEMLAEDSEERDTPSHSTAHTRSAALATSPPTSRSEWLPPTTGGPPR